MQLRVASGVDGGSGGVCRAFSVQEDDVAFASLGGGVSAATGAIGGAVGNLGGASLAAVGSITSGITGAIPGVGKSSDGKKKHWWSKSKKET